MFPMALMFPMAVMTFMIILGCADERPTALLQQARKHFASAARVDVTGNVPVFSESGELLRVSKPNYSITDKKVIAQLAKLVDTNANAYFQGGKYATNTYIVAHIFANEEDKTPIVRLTLLSHTGIVIFEIKGHRTCVTKQPNDELYRRLLKQDFTFPSPEQEVIKASQTSK